VLACFGLVVIYRIDEDLAREQAQWFVIGLILFAATIVLPARLPRARALPLHDRAGRPAAAAAPARAGHRPAGQRRLPRRRARPDLLPAAEFGKIAIVIFLAATCATRAGARARARAASSA
jgi:cell division protein FtsW (lipid II flippase)